MSLFDRFADMFETREAADSDGYNMTSFLEGDIIGDVLLIERYQNAIDILYRENLILSGVINSLKLKRDEMLDKVLKFCSRFGSIEIGGVTIQRGLLRDRNIPIEWDTEKRLEGEEHARVD